MGHPKQRESLGKAQDMEGRAEKASSAAGRGMGRVGSAYGKRTLNAMLRTFILEAVSTHMPVANEVQEYA